MMPEDKKVRFPLLSWQSFLWSALWLTLMAAALASRPFLPVDETRYLAVAWEMWRSGDFLVPHLNGETYSHKPPLLFWLINLGWGVFGMNDWWPRLVAPLFGLGCIFLTFRLSFYLWPACQKTAQTAPLILMGCLFWTLFTTLTMFDMILAFWALLGLLGIVLARQGEKRKGFALLALAVGFGILTKGPAILLHVLPAALLAPVWDLGEERSKGWFLGVGLATLAGVGLALLWAVPAAISGGEAYGEAIFWGQSAGRMVKSFAHGRPWWWYFAVLPALILPWSLWPPFWRALRTLWGSLKDRGVRFCLSWFLPAFIAFSLISGKQLHYLLPIFPALALVFAHLLAKDAGQTLPEKRRYDLVWPALLFVLLPASAALFGLNTNAIAPSSWRIPEWIGELDYVWVLLPITLAGVVMGAGSKETLRAVAALSMLSACLVVMVHFVARPALSSAYDLAPLSETIGRWQEESRPVAYNGKYHGQFQFLGRLKKPIEVIRAETAARWAQDNPNGLVVDVSRASPKDLKPDYVQPFRGRFIAVWPSLRIMESPDLLNR
jgi:4-amino-4-deoxy-L-arabinose transferase-like glycosyltransferase